MVYSLVLEVTRWRLSTWGTRQHAVLDGSLAGRALFSLAVEIGRSFAGVIPAAVNEFGINLTPGETVTITVGAGGAQGALYSQTRPGRAQQMVGQVS